MNLFNKVTTENRVVKTFSYQKDKVKLSFGLRIDIKNELRDFKELLETALREVELELKKHK